MEMDGAGFCIVGTDTDVGKTFVTAALLRAFEKSGVSARGLKPVQSGGEAGPKGCTAPDVDVYCHAAGGNAAPLPLYCLPTPCSPHLAAELAGESIDMEGLLDHCRSHFSQDHVLLLEGAGGIMTPLTRQSTYLDLMKKLDLPLILVADNRLGMINHVRLTLDVLEFNGLNVKALVVNHCRPEPQDPEADDSTESLIRRDNLNYLKAAYPDLLVVENPHHGQGHWAGTELPFMALVKALVPKVGSESGPARPHPSDTWEQVALDRDHIWHPYGPAPGTGLSKNHFISRAWGCHLMGENGPLLDGMSSWWAAIHGYNQPEINRAAMEQINRLSHVMFGGITHEPATALAQKLLEILPPGLDRIFYADSGSVAVEVALKMAIQYWQGMGAPEKNGLITLRGGYHGDTFGAMGVCDPENGMHTHFRSILPRHCFAPRPDCRFDTPFDPQSLEPVTALVEERHHQLAALVVEPIVQGAGGMWFYHPQYLAGLRQLCDQYDILLICDEIATGFGRTGKMFASQWADIVPDILCMGKALTGGYLSLAATVATSRVADGISRGGGVLMHGPTFMGNPLACAVAQQSLELLLDFPWADRVAGVAAALKTGLEPLKDLP
ncbi:MAG: adenosylmethionine--8-amino-7-oxononanoate transaminase, partial [Desulfobacterales bacterium]|nr:adenosylmethionine--8-amino-7-oxononanoate transaminase [Desulfobacterales bacterium]